MADKCLCFVGSTLFHSIVVIFGSLSQRSVIPLVARLIDMTNELTIHMTRTNQQALNIFGIGPKRFQNFGEPIL